MNVYFLSLNPEASARKQWDSGLLQSIFNDLQLDYSQDYTELNENMSGGVVVLPARHHQGLEDQINIELNKLPFVKLFLIGDEEAVFDIDKIQHKNIQITVQNPRPEKHDKYNKIGTGYPTHFIDNKPSQTPAKNLDYFFSGQVTSYNKRRSMMLDNLPIGNGEVIATEGFTQGLEPAEYYDRLSKAKVAYCPSGPELPDTFRLFEALELGCTPIVDEITDKQDFKDYWTWFFGEEPPFTVIRDYHALTGYTKDLVGFYPKINNKCQAWWYRKKWDIKDSILDQEITVVIPVSPINSHPSTEIIDETIASIQYHLPTVKIIVTFDGVREEQKHLEQKYDEHIRRVLYNHPDIYPIIFSEHKHQSGMMSLLLNEYIKTPFILYAEQDTPVEKKYIDLDYIFEKIRGGDSNMIRFHYQGHIDEEHKAFYFERDGKLLKTYQYSQRPHIASTAYYKRLMTYFSPDAICFLEDKLHGIVMNDFLVSGKAGWYQHRIHLYAPEDENIKFSNHLDGRNGGKKYDTKQVF